MISNVRTSAAALRPASRSFDSRVQSSENASANGEQDQDLQRDQREERNPTATEEELGDDTMGMRRPLSRYDGNRLMVDGEDKVLGTILKDQA